MKTKTILMLAVLMIFATTAIYADTVVTTTSSDAYFHSGNNFLSTIFYFVGDLVEFPFRLVGDLFNGLF